MNYENDPLNATTLSDKYEKILRSQVIDETHPGTMLRDFEILLDFIGPDGIGVSNKNNFLSKESLADLNSKLSHPIDIRHKRPRQQSYPNINGLYLLLRSTGFAFPERRGKKLLIVLDDILLQSWGKCNLTERYFILLESWLIRGNPAIVGESESFYQINIMKWLNFFREIPDQGLNIPERNQQEQTINYSPGLLTVALLDLFGIISVRHGLPDEGKGWRIVGVHRTPLGDALLQLMALYYRKSSSYFRLDVDKIEESFGILQPAIQPFFPEWQKNLVIRKPAFHDGIYVFKVSLGDVWRRIAIPGKSDFETLSFSILDAFDFDYDHLYCFFVKDRHGFKREIKHPAMDDPPYANEIRIGDLSAWPGMTMLFWYDFGDNWRFNLKLGRIESSESEIKEPIVLEKHGEPPDQYLDFSF